MFQISQTFSGFFEPALFICLLATRRKNSKPTGNKQFCKPFETFCTKSEQRALKDVQAISTCPKRSKF